MQEDRYLTPQEVADYLKIAKNTVYELIKRGELESFRVGRKIRIEATAVETLRGSMGGSADAQAAVAVPEAENAGGFVICGQDCILDILARELENRYADERILRSSESSYNGLYALYHDRANAVTCHLWDGDTDEYNVPYVLKMLPGVPARIVRLARRRQGLYVKRGNPKRILAWKDLFRQDVSFVNREKGSGTRVLLDEKLRLLGRRGSDIRGYGQTASSHLSVAGWVARGKADTGLGNEKAALQVPALEFVPLQDECYDIVICKNFEHTRPYAQLLDIVRSQWFKDEIESLGGYDVCETGEIIL